MKIQRLVRACARIVALVAGGRPVDCWLAYDVFEEDFELLFETIEWAYNEAKPSLEERARETK